MTVFKLIFILLTIFISILLIYKLFSKHVIIEGAGDPIAKTNEMDKVKDIFANEIVPPTFKVNRSYLRPPEITDAERSKNIQNKRLLNSLKKNLDNTKRKYKNIEETIPTKPKPPNKPKGFNAVLAYPKAIAKYGIGLAKYDIARRKVKNRLDRIQKQMRKNMESISSVQSRINDFNYKISSYADSIKLYNDKNNNNEHKNYRLKDYFVKSSYNSACSGNYMNAEMVQKVLERGCRYLDFEVIFKGDELYITDSSNSKIERITLGSALSVINLTLTKGDPVFINLRLQNPSKIPYNKFESTLKSLQSTLRLPNPPIRRIDETTRISEIMGKCVIIANYDKKDRPGGKYAVDIVMNKDTTVLVSYNNGVIASRSATAEPLTKRMTLVEPNSIGNRFFDTSDISVRRLVLEYKANFTPHRFYKQSDELKKYEKIFDDMKSPYIAMKYLGKPKFDKLDAAADVVV